MSQFLGDRGAAGIFDPALDEGGRKKHLDACRATFVAHPCQTSLPHDESANIIAWSLQNVDRIRRVDVDDTAIVVALAERIANASVKRSVK